MTNHSCISPMTLMATNRTMINYYRPSITTKTIEIINNNQPLSTSINHYWPLATSLINHSLTTDYPLMNHSLTIIHHYSPSITAKPLRWSTIINHYQRPLTIIHHYQPLLTISIPCFTSFLAPPTSASQSQKSSRTAASDMGTSGGPASWWMMSGQSMVNQWSNWWFSHEWMVI